MPGAEPSPGVLYLVGTPIGNLDDLSPRAWRVLALDADPQMNLPWALGLAPDQARTLVPLSANADYVEEKTGRDNIIAWEGYCYVHDDMVLEELERTKSEHPEALVVVHPEARQELLDRADVVTSTSGMVKMASEHDSLIFGTERGLVDRVQEQFPQKTFIALSRAAICGNMKLNDLPKLAWCLDHGQYEVTMDEEIRLGAERSLKRMLEISGGWRSATAAAWIWPPTS